LEENVEFSAVGLQEAAALVEEAVLVLMAGQER
jgi:hypothetical protein